MIKTLRLPLLCTIAALLPAGLAAETASALEVERLDGSALSITNFREHRATAVVFLSSRSPESIAAAESIQQANARYRRRKVMFVGVFPNPSESGDEIRDFCQASGFVFPCYRDPGHKATRRFGAHVTPEAFVLDNTGNVFYSGSVSGLEAAVADIAADAKVRTATLQAGGTPIDRPSAGRKIHDDRYGTISYSSELIFEKIPGAPVHHASSMTLAANGDLLVSWYGGSYESSDDEALYLARRRKGARSWDPPVMLLRNPEQPVGNAVIFTLKSGAVWIIWGRMEASQPMLAHTGWDSTRLMFRVSQDHGHTWSADKPFPMESAGWLPRNLAIRLGDGSTIVPVSDERNNRDLSFFLMTNDNGVTWTRSLDIPNQQSQGEQPAVAQRSDGSLIAFLRTSPRLLQTESFDGGKTWAPAKTTDFKNPDAAISICALRNGNLLLVWNNNERGRSPLHIVRSTDNGKTWSQPLTLESNPGEYSYPSIMQTPDERIHVIYTYRRYSFMHLEFNEDWLTRTERPD